MKLGLRPKDTAGLLPTDILFQNVFWSTVKAKLGWKPLAFDFISPRGAGDVLVLTRHLSCGMPVAYVPQGPEYSPRPDGYGSFLEELSDVMVGYLGPGIAFIRYDLPWVSPYAESEVHCGSHEWRGHPEPRLRELRMNFGTMKWNLRKAISDLTVADALILDIGRAEDEILKGMKPKTRYNIHLARHKGVSVLHASEEMLPAFYQLFGQTARRKSLPLCSYEHFAALFSTQAVNEHPGGIHFLLAVNGRDILAGAIIAISGRTATYLFGASADHNRNLMGSYAVQWSAIQLARTRGCSTYDMGAVSPRPDAGHPFYGLYRFKTGFGGNIVHRTGTWDYPLDSDAYATFRNLEVMERTCQAKRSQDCLESPTY